LWLVLSAFPAVALPPVVVSSKLSTESAMLGEMMLLLLERAGIPTVDRLRLGATPVVRKALVEGQVDLYVEYTGNAGLFFNRSEDPAFRDLEAGYRLGARLDLERHHLVWLEPARASNSWALAVRGDLARTEHLRTLSDFAAYVRRSGRVVLACSAEFANAGTLRSLERTYGFRLQPSQKIVLAGGETSATIAAAAAGTNGTNVAMVYGTDGGIVAAGLVLLDDDRHDQPIYAPVPLLRASVLADYPRIPDIVRPLMAGLDATQLQQLNARVQIEGESPGVVARDYLKHRGLLP
jgi:osmoprotectant transport system substrate-binding protein